MPHRSDSAGSWLAAAELPVAAERAHTTLVDSSNGRCARPLNQVLGSSRGARLVAATNHYSVSELAVSTSFLDTYDLAHYVVIEGNLMPATRAALLKWLKAQRARPVSSSVWTFSARADGESSRKRSETLRAALAPASLPHDADPFAVHLLGPCGAGHVAFKMDLPQSLDGGIGAVGFGISF